MKTLREMMDLIESAQMTDEGYKDYKAPHNRGRENIDNHDWTDEDYPNSPWDDGYDRGCAYGTNNKPRPKHPEGSKEYQQYMDGYEKGVIAHAKRAKACLPDDEQLEETSDDPIAKIDELFRDK